MVYKRQLFFQYSRPSGCDTSKLLSDDLKNKLYYDGFQKMLYHYSHQEKPVHNVYWFFFFGAEEDLNSNDDDRSQRLKQGGVAGAAF